MSRSSQHACDRCERPTAKKRLTKTAVGVLCTRCAGHLPPRLRKPVGDQTEARRG